MLYSWLVEMGKALSYYNDKAMIKKDSSGPQTAREGKDSSEKKGLMNESQKEITKLQGIIKEKDINIEELKEENDSLKTSNTKLKGELKQFQVISILSEP